MSQQQDYTIKCPKCGEEQVVHLYESINVQLNPELKDQLMMNQLNTITCSKCEILFRVDKNLLYSDPERNTLIYLIPIQGDNIQEGEQIFSDSLRKMNEALPPDVYTPDVHLVFNQVELIERIFLFEADLNERVIEYIKYMIYSRNLEQIDPRTKNILFNAEDSTPEELCFIIQDIDSKKFESMLHFGRKEYDALNEMFDSDEQTATLLELLPGPYINARALFLRDGGIEIE